MAWTPVTCSRRQLSRGSGSSEHSEADRRHRIIIDIRFDPWTGRLIRNLQRSSQVVVQVLQDITESDYSQSQTAGKLKFNRNGVTA